MYVQNAIKHLLYMSSNSRVWNTATSNSPNTERKKDGQTETEKNEERQKRRQTQ